MYRSYIKDITIDPSPPYPYSTPKDISHDPQTTKLTSLIIPTYFLHTIMKTLSILPKIFIKYRKKCTICQDLSRRTQLLLDAIKAQR